MHRHDYPDTHRGSTVEALHGQHVEDPYRWLEDLDSRETRDWVRSQNVLARSHLDALASRPWFHAVLTAFVHRPRAGTPEKMGGRYLVARNDGTLEQDQVYVADTLDELASGGRLLLDPNAFAGGGGTSLADPTASRDGALLAYLVSDGGSDRMSLRLLRLDGTTPDEPFEVLTDVRYSKATWLPDHSFLYTHYDLGGGRSSKDTAVLPGGALRRHRVGTPQDADDVVLEFPDDAYVGMEPTLSPDGRWLAVAIRRGTAKRNRLWLYPVTTDGDRSVLGEPMKVVDVDIAELAVVRIEGDDLYLRTDHRAPFGRVVHVDLSGTSTARTVFEDVVAERESALRQAVAAGDGILTVHLEDAQPVVTRHSLDGAVREVVPLPGGTVVALNASAGDDEVFVGMSSVSSPLTAYRVDLGDGSVHRIEDLEPGRSEWTAPSVTSERRRARSLDDTEVPYFLFHRSDLALDRTRPTLLYGKGGFKVPALNQFRPAFSSWLAAGGVVAIANLRGGGEFGAAWYETGRARSKQNVFDDFAAVAEHLIASGVTTSDQLALHGGSNGGLTVAALMTQRPELAAVSLPAVGLMDMLRFHRFTIGAAWVNEYGSPDDPDDFAVLRAYSPLHNLRPGVSLPATLVLVGEGDDRVVPAHSFKFTAAAQHAQSGGAPVLARIEASTGHAHGKPASAIVAENADLLAFAAAHTGLRPPG